MKVEKLGNIAENLDNKRIPLNDAERKAKTVRKLYPYIGANNIVDYIDEYIFDEQILCVAEDGGSWGFNERCANIYNGKTWVNNHAHVLKSNGKADLNFLRFFLNYSDLKRHITGTTRGKLTRSKLDNIDVPLPPLEEQIQIATVLLKAENLIAKRKKSIELLDEFVKSTFLEMFGDPVRNEKGWEIEKLGETGSLDRGVSKNRPRNAPELLGGIYPLIQTGDVTNSGLYIKNHTQTYSELGLNQSKMWKKETLCITIAANIARTGILDFDACFPDSVVGFIPNRHKVDSIYIHFLFGFIQELLEKNAPQAAQKNINLEILRNLSIPKPAIELQNEFAKIVNKVEVLKEKHQKSLEELENLYGSLSQRAFKGELCSNAELQIKDTSSIPENRKGFAKQVLGGKIVSLFKDDENFTNIKFQKLQYLAEHLIEEDLFWNYRREAAGPYDNRFMHTVFNHLEKNKWFEQKYSKFKPMEKSGDIEKYFQGYFGKKSDKLNNFFNLLKNASEKLCEAIATIYAVWNNHIIQGLEFDKDRVKKEFFEWSKRKKVVFTEEEFEKALEWMQRHQIIPAGFGQLIKEKK